MASPGTSSDYEEELTPGASEVGMEACQEDTGVPNQRANEKEESLGTSEGLSGEQSDECLAEEERGEIQLHNKGLVTQSEVKGGEGKQLQPVERPPPPDPRMCRAERRQAQWRLARHTNFVGAVCRQVYCKRTRGNTLGAGGV